MELGKVILGCGGFGGVGSSPLWFARGETEEQANEIMDTAWQMGITMFDTADAYGGGRSESMIGKWRAAKDSVVRSNLKITTKVFNPMEAGADHGLARQRILRQIDSSLHRLGVTSVDLYLTHEEDPEVDLVEVLSTFQELISVGKVKAVGASNICPKSLRLALDLAERSQRSSSPLARFSCVQNSYSLLDREPELPTYALPTPTQCFKTSSQITSSQDSFTDTQQEDEGDFFDRTSILGICRRENIAFTPFGPLRGGWLTGKYHSMSQFSQNELPKEARMNMRPEPYECLKTEQVFRGLEALNQEAADRSLSMAGLSLAWLLSEPAVTSVIVGPRKPEHLQPVREALGVHLTLEERKHIASLLPFLPALP